MHLKIFSWLKRKKKKNVFEQKSQDPWSGLRSKRRRHNLGFFHSVSNFFGTFKLKYGGIGKHKIHIPFLRELKRVIFGGLFVWYIMLSFMSFHNIPFFLVFLFTAFLALDYLWKTHRPTWKKKENET